MSTLRPILAAAAAALLLSACATDGGPAWQGAAERDAAKAMRGNPQARTIYREGPVTGREGDLSPEESARQEAITYCSSVNMAARVLDVRKQRMPARDTLRGRATMATEYERVGLTFACERGQP